MLQSFFCHLYRTFLPATRQSSIIRKRINPAVWFFDTNKRVKLVFLDPKLNSIMAPRTAKAKKTPSTKAVQNGAPKKGNAKTVEEPEIDAEMADEVPVIEKNDKKTKKSRKAEGDNNGLEETNGVNAQPPKKGKKNKTGDSASAQKHASNSDDAEGDTSNPNDIEEQIESNGHTEEAPAKGKKTTKKEVATSKSKTDSKTSTRGKKNAKQNVENEVTEKDEAIEEKSKTGGKGRTRKVPQKANKEEAEPEEKNESGEEEIKTETSKGKKRGQTKAKKEKTPESESDVLEEENDMPVEEPKKKETKGKKNQGKKAKLAENEDEGEEKQEPATKKRKVTKKDKKDEVKVEEPTEEAAPEVKPAKGKRGPKKAEPVAEDDAQATGDAAGKRRRKADEKVSAEDAKKKAPPKNKSTTDYESIDFSNSSKNAQGKEWNLKIASWNVDGIRAWMSKGGLDYIKYEKPDILCLQETKCAKDKLPDEIANLPGYHAYWQGSDKDGYAGVGIYTTKLAMNVQYGLQNEELDNEGRIITAEYEQFYLICTYVPNAGRKLVTLPKRLHWNDEFRKHVKALNEKKPVIICGDMNVAHNEIDLSNPKSNKKNAGFTEEERAGMTDLLGDGFVDTYRRLHPDRTGAYTFWTYMMNSRAKNVGWRLDYFLVSERLLPALCDNVIRSAVYGSDHCPIALYLHITSADKPKE